MEILLSVLFILFFVFHYVLMLLGKNLAFDPTRISNEKYELEVGKKKFIEKFTIKTNDNEILKCILYNRIRAPSWTDIIFLYSHGNRGCLLDFMEKDIMTILSRYGSIVLYDYRGYGASSGFSSEEGLYNDTFDIYNYLVGTKKINENKIIIYGFSVGTFVSSKLISLLVKHKYTLPRALIMESPFINSKETGLVFLQRKFIDNNIFTRFMVNNPYFKLDNKNNMKEINNKIPIYIFHSLDDRTVPFSHGLEISKLCNDNMLNMYGSHNYPIYTDEMIKKIEELAGK